MRLGPLRSPRTIQVPSPSWDAVRLWPPAEKPGLGVAAGRRRNSTSPPVTESGRVDAAVTTSLGVAADALDSTIGPATSGLASSTAMSRRTARGCTGGSVTGRLLVRFAVFLERIGSRR